MQNEWCTDRKKKSKTGKKEGEFFLPVSLNEHKAKLTSSQAYKTAVGLTAVCADHVINVFSLQSFTPVETSIKESEPGDQRREIGVSSPALFPTSSRQFHVQASP